MATMNTCGFALHAEARTITGCTRERLLPGTQYVVFAAAFHGCKICLEHFITNGINPNIRSNNRKFTALDWAKYGCSNRFEKAHEHPLVQYLQEILGDD